VLVRYIVNDDLKQAEVVDRLFRDSSLSGEDLFVPIMLKNHSLPDGSTKNSNRPPVRRRS
jgi:hypothetical protein